MAATAAAYNNLWAYLLSGTIDLDTDVIKVALVGSAYTPDATHDEWADVSANEITGTNYTAGGVALTGKAVTLSGAVAKFDADDAQWPGLTATFRRAVIYAEVARNGKTNPLIAHVLLDSTDVDIVCASVDYRVIWSTSGILTLAAAA